MGSLEALFDRTTLTAWDVVDILVVSLLIYEALKIIRGTRAVQLVLGTVVLLVLVYATQTFPLETVGWLIRNVLTYLVFAAIVLFQADIRRALAHLGRAPVFRIFGKSERTADAIEEVVTATEILAKEKIGAIIVLEREIGLRNYIESGIPVDAVVSYDLLTTIFQPKTMLHDGAVIIAEDRIAAAACFLPLAAAGPHLDRVLGSRHRAAVGLTEETDAVAVVVSEERGEIALARHGHIERPLSAQDLRRQLYRLILQRHRDRPQQKGEVDG
jgi:diadenylate cyclase